MTAGGAKMSNAVFGLSVVTLYLASPFSALIVLDLFKNRFPEKNNYL